MVAAALGGQGAIAGAMTGRADETTALSERLIERAKAQCRLREPSFCVR